MQKLTGILSLLVVAIGVSFYPELRRAIAYPEPIHWHLPTFLHVVLLSWIHILLTGYPRGRWYLVPAFWVTANITFECIQGLAAPHYGTFDFRDIVAALIGGLVAMFTILMARPRPFQKGAFLLTLIAGSTVLTATQCDDHDHGFDEPEPQRVQQEEIFPSDVDYPSNPIVSELSLDSFAGAVALALTDDFAVIQTESGLVNIINVTDPGSPKLISTCECADQGTDVFVDNAYVYAVSSSAGLQILDLAETGDLQPIGTLTGNFTGVVVDEERAYLIGPDGVTVADLTDPTGPAKIDTAEIPGNETPVKLVGTGGDILLASSSEVEGGDVELIRIVDDKIEFTTLYFDVSPIVDIASDSDFIYVSKKSNDIDVIDFTDETNTLVTGILEKTTDGLISVSGHRLVFDKDNKIHSAATGLEKGFIELTNRTSDEYIGDLIALQMTSEYVWFLTENEEGIVTLNVLE